MAISAEIRLLDPGSPQHGYKINFINEIRDLLAYSHSRLYAALVAIGSERATKERREMQLLLQKEVVSFNHIYLNIAT